MVEQDWAITNWFNGLMLGVEDRDADLAQALDTTLGRIKHAVESQAAVSRQAAEQIDAAST